jgi:hypothetical protein
MPSGVQPFIIFICHSKKLRLKKPIFSIVIVLAILISCKKTGVPFTNNAVITGSDARMCPCCGGYMINFDGETRPYTGDFKLIENSSGIGISDRDAFPIFVRVAWRMNSTNACHGIIITRITRN